MVSPLDYVSTCSLCEETFVTEGRRSVNFYYSVYEGTLKPDYVTKGLSISFVEQDGICENCYPGDSSVDLAGAISFEDFKSLDSPWVSDVLKTGADFPSGEFEERFYITNPFPLEKTSDECFLELLEGEAEDLYRSLSHLAGDLRARFRRALMNPAVDKTKVMEIWGQAQVQIAEELLVNEHGNSSSETDVREAETDVREAETDVREAETDVDLSEPPDKLQEVLISVGTFEMGDGSEDENTRHKVTLSRSFYMMDAPITQALYEAVMGNNPSRFTGKGGFRGKGDSKQKPVEQVNWFDVLKFANALSEREGLDVAYEIEGESVTWNREANGYRLPTEAEWEYAARGGEDYKYAGSDNLDEVGWYDENSGSPCETHPVRQKKPNGYGLYDMSGNVGEWCWDWWDDDLDDYPEGSQVDPVGPENGSYRVFRGGYWFNVADGARVVNRDCDTPAFRRDSVGARLLRWQ